MLPHDPTPMLILLDGGWRPRNAVPVVDGWQAALLRLIVDEHSWVALLQRRAITLSPCPRRDDLIMTRLLSRCLLPLGVHLADHVIEAGDARFSFRRAGLL